MTKKLQVVMTTEGTYPYCAGGVSTWADILVNQLGDIEFSLLAIMMNPYQIKKFELPDNVAQLINVPLWGTEEPTEYISGQAFHEIYINKLKPDEAIRDTFINIMEMMICSIFSTHHDLDALGNGIIALYDIFQVHDYRNLFRSAWLWDFFCGLMLRLHQKPPLFTREEFPDDFSLFSLIRRVHEQYPELFVERISGDVEELNNILRFPSFVDLWIVRHGDSQIWGELRKLVDSTADCRQQLFDQLPVLRQQEIVKLNRLLLEKAFRGECPEHLDQTDESLTVYDNVESLRWLYRFLITLLAPLPAADVYHSSAAAFCGLPCIIAKLKYGSRFMLTEHGIYVREQYLYASRERIPFHAKRFLMGLVSLISKLNYHFADLILPVCEYNKRWELGFEAEPDKIRVIYNGIDTDRFRKIQHNRDSRPTVVMVARIDPLKDIETYIRTCAEVRKTVGNILFKLYGPQTDEEYYLKCRTLVKELDLEDNFVFSGLTSTPEIANNEGDVVLLTSISEAFPFSVIEGMACEKPIISSDVGGTSEVLEGYGFVVQPKNFKEFAQKVVYALEHPDLCAEMGIAARQQILNGFRTQDMVSNYRQAYFSLAGISL